MKLSYVVYNERPVSGLMQTQVYSLLKEIARQDPAIKVELVAFWQPWVAWKYRRDIRNVRSDLLATGVGGCDVPWAWIPSRHFLYRTWLFPFLWLWATVLFRTALRGQRDIVHCRGYLASFLAARLARRRGYQTVFDMRSLWPKEHVTIGAWKTTESIYKLWRWIERDTLERSDAAVGVSQGMLDEVTQITRGAGAKAVLIPITVDTTEFAFDPVARAKLRADLGWNACKIIAYQGSLGLMNSNLREVAQYMVPLAQWFPDIRFLVLTSNTGVDVQAELDACGLSRDRVAVRRPSSAELPKWLSAADAGIHAMSPGPDSATRLGVKVVEYLSCSLPILVNQYVGAAASLVRERGVGEVLDLEDASGARERMAAFLLNSQVPRADCRRLAEERFSVVSCARQYREVYSRLLASRK